MNYYNEVKQEKYGWRDESISRRHRLYGKKCTMTDIDFVCVEYSLCEVVALIEYKHINAKKPPNLEDSNCMALTNLATRAKIPFFYVYYDENSGWIYTVYPINIYANKWLSLKTTLSEQQYVRLLYKIREIAVEDQIISRLNNNTYQNNGTTRQRIPVRRKC